MPKKIATDSKSAITRAKLLEAGAKLFFDHSFDSVSVEEITQVAGVAHGLLFHYFKTKLDFYVEVYSQFVAELQERRVLATASGSPEQRLRKFIEMHMEVFRQRGEAHTYQMRGSTHAKIIAVSETSRRQGVLLLLSFFSSSQPTTVDKLVCRAWLDLMDQLLLAWIENPDISADGVIDLCVELFHETLSRSHLLIGARDKAEVDAPKAPSAPPRRSATRSSKRITQL
ncbi:TetR/AcrR family transcriptional regulator [Novosphingobium terrae]|uniref:TetR/AcrR family transcriptional regulator n=1 Tax=Novosphingobium terrae TaxID=2726189 RepID=UPI00197CD18F|nr:TetR/AcrR family transcriptional regulator [Novosphingobium terrae]